MPKMITTQRVILFFMFWFSSFVYSASTCILVVSVHVYVYCVLRLIQCALWSCMCIILTDLLLCVCVRRVRRRRKKPVTMLERAHRGRTGVISMGLPSLCLRMRKRSSCSWLAHNMYISMYVYNVHQHVRVQCTCTLYIMYTCIKPIYNVAVAI